MPDVLVDLVHDGGGDETVLDGAREEVGSRAAGETRLKTTVQRLWRETPAINQIRYIYI